MSTLLDPHASFAPDAGEPTLADRARDVIAVLEAVVDDRALLADLPDEHRRRLLAAAGRVSRPDAIERRALVKASKRERKAARVRESEAVLEASGIRQRRRDALVAANAGAGLPEGVAGPRLFAPAPFVPEPPESIADDDEASAALDFAVGDASRASGETHNCYVCKRDYAELHHFYDQLCPSCAALNWAKRTELADLSGRVALLTGGRVKIGYQAGLKLLRAGATLIVTTRFPRDSAARYAAEPDFAEWSHRLEIFGLDLRHTPSVEAFCQHLLATRERLDFIVNNACQTVRRPPDFYRHLMAGETAAAHALPAHARAVLGAYEGLRAESLIGAGGASAPLATGERPVGLTHAAALSQVALLPEELHEHAAAEARATLFPEGLLDEDAQQVDLRERNSWRLQLDEVSSVELLEVQLVNAIAPYVLNARLRPLMRRTPGREKHIVNVSAMEGQFYRRFKTTRHPHTNMAKAALNMMTRTSAADYVRDGIHMNAVDTGWVTDEDPAALAARKTAEHRFHPPLDIVDGAARIVDPIINGVNTGVHVWGQFLKDYRSVPW